MFRILAMVAIASLLAAPVVAAKGDDWTMYRRDAAHNPTVDVNAVGAWSLRWSFDTGQPVDSSPVISGGMVYVGSASGTFYALDSMSGAVRWSFDAGWYHFQPSPAIDENGVYSLSRSRTLAPDGEHVFDENGTLRSHDAQTGTVRWSLPFEGDMFGSPTLLDGHLFVGAGKRVVSVATKSGTIEWQFATPDPHYASPAICGDLVIAATTGGDLYALSRTDGTLRWHQAITERLDASPTCADESIFISTGPGRILAVRQRDGTAVWDRSMRESIQSSAAVKDGVVYVATSRGTLFALDADTGQTQWTARLAAGVVFSSPTILGDTLYVGSFPRNLYAVSTKTGNVSVIFEAGQVIQSSPAFAENALFFSSRDNYVYALENDHVVQFKTGSAGAGSALNFLLLIVGVATTRRIGRRRNGT